MVRATCGLISLALIMSHAPALMTDALHVGALPAQLRTFLERRVSAALAGAVVQGRIDDQPIHPAAPALLDGLVAGAPDGDLSSWAHSTTLLAAKALQNDPVLCDACVSGRLGLLDAAEANAKHTAAAEQMYHVINGHHRELREANSEGGEHADADSAWEQVTANQTALRAYARAATQIGERAWVRLGIDWMVGQAKHFFHEGGGTKRSRKEAVKHSWASTRAAPAPDVDSQLMRLAADAIGPPPGQPVKLLDVGACGTLFDGYDGIESMAIDLCPQHGNERVYRCDFLKLDVGGSAPLIEPDADFAAGTLRSLPAGSFDVVAMSLVLSYVPTPRQRGAMILKARQLLPTPDTPAEQLRAAASAAGGAEPGSVKWRRGLLLLVDTFSVDRKAARWGEQTYLHAWVEAVESAGFVFLQHATLERSHALAFATAPMTDAELDALATVEAPDMRMRREERGEWQ
jgi:25S rRNA (adenine2142-N1)-methyltransferase